MPVRQPFSWVPYSVLKLSCLVREASSLGLGVCTCIMITCSQAVSTSGHSKTAEPIPLVDAVRGADRCYLTTYTDMLRYTGTWCIQSTECTTISVLSVHIYSTDTADPMSAPFICSSLFSVRETTMAKNDRRLATAVFNHFRTALLSKETTISL